MPSHFCSLLSFVLHNSKKTKNKYYQYSYSIPIIYQNNISGRGIKYRTRYKINFKIKQFDDNAIYFDTVH